MAQNYTKMWDAFLGGEWAGGEEAVEGEYEQQTRDFYKNIIGPAFGLDEEFGKTDLEGAYAQFSNVDLETAERTFRSEIGDPYGGGTGDPFSWEKVSRYNTGDPTGVDRLQDLLEDQLYGQGKFLGGQTGADYGTATAKELETYTSGLTGQRESLTYEGLKGGAGIASGTGGSVLRSGESAAVAEDVLIEAYKKAKTLGSEYREGSEGIEQTLESDLDTALTTYLEAIDDEKSRWFSSVMSNVQTFKAIGMDPLEEGETYATMTDLQLEEAMPDYYNEWSCGYGQKWDGDKCVDTEAYGGEEGEVAGYQFRDDPAGVCGIGEILQDGECRLIEELEGLVEDNYGLLCDASTMTTCWDGLMVCDLDDCSAEPVEEEEEESETGGLECYSDADCGPCDRCDAGGCLPWPEQYAPPGCGSGGTKEESLEKGPKGKVFL